jgi:thioredoxin
VHASHGNDPRRVPEDTMATIELTGQNFDNTVSENEIVFIDFWADWCGPCKAFAPTYENASDANTDIVFGKVDTQHQQQLAAHFQIRSIPTLLVFRDQIPVFMQPGALPADVLGQLIQQVRDLDMDEVRKAYEEAQTDA